MSAIVCRKRSNYAFDELQYTPTSASKRSRCSTGTASPPVSSASVYSSLSTNASPSFTRPSVSDSAGNNDNFLNYLRKLFPHVEQQYLERALEASGNDLDSAISNLNDICLEPAATRTDDRAGVNVEILSIASGEPATNNIPKDGSEWVDLLVREIMNSSGIEDARARAFRALDVLEKSIVARANVEATKNFHNESMILKEQVKLLLGENTILKKAVTIQHQRQKDFEEKNQELESLKQLLSRYQEQLRKLEVNNYALAMHLKQSQQGSSMPGRFHPDIF
ncbi:hypothetical protein IEQ34_020749 [Dendrobium chrysotoxum]|uniref:CUE domain-containing protein n=1 Tax=Dendrobium chrysotoxum TaxID=161865 RepID=A0AAV7G1L1_DENCH|nr:hypothetical protein IEQ34_020749 [Dendrobium chrysotoxum]